MPGGAWRRERCQNTDPDLYKFIIKIFKQDKYMENDNTRVRSIKCREKDPAQVPGELRRGGQTAFSTAAGQALNLVRSFLVP